MNARPSFFASMAEPRKQSIRAFLFLLADMADQAADEWAETGSDEACETLARCEELIHRALETA